MATRVVGAGAFGAGVGVCSVVFVRLKAEDGLTPCGKTIGRLGSDRSSFQVFHADRHPAVRPIPNR